MTKQEMIENLNEDLAGELGAIIQYLTYAAKTTGPYRPQLSQFFLGEVADEQLHAQYLANKIVALGGEPATVPRPVPAAATNKEMVEQVLLPNRRRRGTIRSGPNRRKSWVTRDWWSSSKTWCATKRRTRKKPSGCSGIGLSRSLRGRNDRSEKVGNRGRIFSIWRCIVVLFAEKSGEYGPILPLSQ